MAYSPVLLLCCCWVVLSVVTAVPLHEEWQSYQDKFGKNYTKDEETTRFAVWKKNHALVSGHNEEFGRGLRGYRLGMNALSDKLPHELRNEGFHIRRARGFTRHVDLGQWGQSRRGTPSQLPPEVDWRKKGCVGDVRNQGTMGTSSDLAALGTLEGTSCATRGRFVELSDQNLIDCCNLTRQPLPDDYIECVCKNGGIDTEAAYPSTGKQGPCRFDPAHIGATCKSVGRITPRNETALAAVVASSGTVAVLVDASRPSFQLYSSGVYDDPACDPRLLDHAMLVVGYGTTGGQDYWIVQNSWGKSWGVEGYIMMSRNKDNQCGIASAVAYPAMWPRDVCGGVSRHVTQ